jgi:hypothetical protein
MTHHPTDLLPLYLAGEVDEPERLQIAAHLAACTACARALERVRVTSARLDRLPIAPLPHAFTEGIIEASRRRRPLAVSPVWLASIAAAVVIGIALGLMWSAVRTMPATPPATTGQQFMLMMLEPIAERLALGPEESRERGRLMTNWVAGMREHRSLVGGERLHDEGGRLVSNQSVDDRFGQVPAGELFTGYLLIRAASYDEATEIAKSCPILAFGGRVAVRAVR